MSHYADDEQGDLQNHFYEENSALEVYRDREDDHYDYYDKIKNRVGKRATNHSKDVSLKHFSPSNQSMELDIARRNKSLIFLNLKLTRSTTSFLPLIYLVERVCSKQRYFDIYQAFEQWSLQYGSKHGPLPPTPLLSYSKIYHNSFSPRISFEQSHSPEKMQLKRATYAIVQGLNRLKALYEEPLKVLVYKKFSHWKKWYAGCHQINNLVPIPLRILVTLHHSALWKIFYSYSATHRPVTMSNQYTPISEHQLGNSKTPGRDSSPNRSPDRLNRSFPTKLYTQKLVKKDEIWMLLRDCTICPLHIGRWKFDHLLSSIRQRISHASIDRRDASLYYERSPVRQRPRRRVSEVGPIDGSSSPTATLTDSNGVAVNLMNSFTFEGKSTGSSSGNANLNSSINSVGGHSYSGNSNNSNSSNYNNGGDEMVSFDMFIRLLWRIMAELLEMPDMDMTVGVPAIKQVLRSLENNAVVFSIRLINMGGWDRFIAQYKEKQNNQKTHKIFL